MSKERNLTFINKGVPVVEGEKHRKLSHKEPALAMRANCASYLQSTPLRARQHEGELDAYIVGPAINRLHEFEKLEMEPEEIERLQKYYEACSSNVKELSEKLCIKELIYVELELENKKLITILDQKDRNEKRLHRNVEELEKMVKGRDVEIERWEDEYEELKKENERLRGDFFNVINGTDYYKLSEENKDLRHKLHEKTEEYGVKIMAMSEDMDKLEEEIKNKDNKIHNLIDACDRLEKVNQELKDGVFRDEIIKNYITLVEKYGGENAVLGLKNANQFQEIVELREENQRLKEENETMNTLINCANLF